MQLFNKIFAIWPKYTERKEKFIRDHVVHRLKAHDFSYQENFKLPEDKFLLLLNIIMELQRDIDILMSKMSL